MNEKETLLKELMYWQTEFIPVNNMGKYARQVRIDAIKEKLKNLENGEIKNEEKPQQEGEE